jgi:hypothetical protein
MKHDDAVTSAQFGADDANLLADLAEATGACFTGFWTN